MSNLCCTGICDLVLQEVQNVTSANSATDVLLINESVEIMTPNRSSCMTLQQLVERNWISTVPNGYMVYLCDANVPVIASNGSWIGLDGRPLPAANCQNAGWSWGSNSSCQQLQLLASSTNLSAPTQEYTRGVAWLTMAAGQYTSFLNTSLLGVFWTGANNCGQLGTGAASGPTQVLGGGAFYTCGFAAGCLHTAGIKTDGTLRAWGSNANGRLGDNTVTTRLVPTQEISGSTNWCFVTAGGDHTAAIKSTDNSLWVWGANQFGGGGDNTLIARSSPRREISSATNWCTVSAACQFTTALKNDGTLWAWGCNQCGAIGDNASVNRSSPVREITSSSTWCSLGSGRSHTAAIKTDGTLWSWGANFCGQLGNSLQVMVSSPVQELTSSTNWCAVDGGSYHTAAIKYNGTLWSWGSNCCGQLGTRNTISRSSPVQEVSCRQDWWCVATGHNHTLALTSSWCLSR